MGGRRAAGRGGGSGGTGQGANRGARRSTRARGARSRRGGGIRGTLAAVLALLSIGTGAAARDHLGAAPVADSAGAAGALDRDRPETSETPGRTTGRKAAGPDRDGPDREDGGQTSRSADRPPAAERRDRALQAAVAPIAARAPQGAAVAVYDLDAGTTAAYQGRKPFSTASIAKVDILAALLMQRHREGRALTEGERRHAEKMIIESDNEATNALYTAIGWDTGLNRANRDFGLTETIGGADRHFGLTSTTAEDQLRLLRLVFGEPGALDAESQTYIRQLMGAVVAHQRWGVSAAADPGTRPMLKNGWVPLGERNLWTVNSIGLVESGGHRVAVAVLTSGWASMDSGTALTGELAEAAARAVRGAG